MQITPPKQPRIFAVQQVVLSLLLLIFLLPGISRAASPPAKNLFPSFPAIEPNVQFWEDIYTRYGTNIEVLHDNRDLSIVYEAVPLMPPGLPGASKLNKKYLQNVKESYRKALVKISAGGQPKSKVEKRVHQIFTSAKRKVSYREAAENLRYQQGMKEQFRKGVIRSGAYIDQMKSIFRQYGLPEDLAYLPHVESSFNPAAYSKMGAAGAWQFTRSTGQEFLTINYTLDERRDILLSTHAAAKYLKRNFTDLGTWPLALTAYNYGHHGMRRAVNELKTYEKIFASYDKGYFKFASRNFYAEFLAAVHSAKEAEHSPTLHKDPPLRILTVTMQGYIPVKTILRHFQIKEETLRKYNPALRNPVWNGEKHIPKGYSLRLPNNRSTWQRTASLPRNKFSESQKRSLFYTVRKGDTASGIAQRENVSLSALIKANNLNKKGSVYIGQALKIPGKSIQQRPATHKQQLLVIKKPTKRKQRHQPPPQQPSVHVASDYDVFGEKTINGLSFGEIRVQPEESVALFARWLRVPSQDICRLNGMENAPELTPGQRLSIPLTHVSVDDFVEQRLEFFQETEEDFYQAYKITGLTRYTVMPGDTLWALCEKKFEVPLWLLKKYNMSLNYTSLQGGRVLTIPLIEAI